MEAMPLATLHAPRLGRTRRRCLVCGFAEVRTDEVPGRAPLVLAECPRCEHRWTERAAAPAPSTAPVWRTAPAPGAAAA